MSAAHPRQLCALGFGAVSTAAFLMLPRVGWLWAGVGGMLAAMLLYLMYRLRHGVQSPIVCLSHRRGGRALLALMAAGNCLLLGASAQSLCDIYPTASARPLIGLLLLLAAVCAAAKGTAVVGRVSAIGFFLMTALLVPVLCFAFPQIKIENLKPVTELQGARLAALLAPTGALLLCVQKGQRCRVWAWLLAGVLTVFAAAFVTAGVVSSGVARDEGFAFYTLGKNISFFGAMERLEPLISVALSLGGFALLALPCAVNGEICAALGAKENFSTAANLLLGGAAVFLPCSDKFTAAMCAIFWGILPLVALLVVSRDKNKKISTKTKKSVDKSPNV